MEYCENYEDFPDPNLDWPLVNFPYQSSVRTKITNLERWTAYDNTIGCRTLKGPLERGKYSILDIYEINKNLLITWGEDFYECNTRMIEFNVKPLCVVNCLNFGTSFGFYGGF